MNRQTCTDHCSGCGRHFHGTGAFDRHLRRVNEGVNGYGARSYDLVHTVEVGLQVWTDEGWCLMTGRDEHPVTIWQVFQTEAQRAALARAWPGSADSSDTSSQ